MSTWDPDEEGKTIATFLSVYLAARRRMAQRFADRESIFPGHILSPFSIIVYSCKDGVIIDFLQPADETTLSLVREETRSVRDVLTAITFGVFTLGEKGLPDLSKARPRVRITNLSLENKATGQKRDVHDIQLWWRTGIAFSTDAAQSMALQDVQDSLMWYAVVGSPKPLPLDVLYNLERILDEYECLIDDVDTPESKLQSFLTEYPILLTPVFEQVIPKQQIGCGKEYEIDFVIKQEAGRYLVVEIEKPSTPMVTGQGNFTHEFTHAEGQMLGFLGWIDENVHTAKTAMPGVDRPRGLVVIGRRRDLDDKGLMTLARKNALLTRFEFITFDDLLDRGRLVIRAFRSLGQ
jgi:hypothetical protein